MRKEQEISLTSKLSSISKESKSNSDIKFISNQESLKSILRQLILKYTNKSVVDCIIFCFLDNQPRKKKKKLNSELDSIIYKIYQKYDPPKLFQALLSLKENDKVNELINLDEEFNNNNDVKIFSLESTSEGERFLDITKDEKNKRYHSSHNINRDKKYEDNVVIDINNNYKNKTNNKIETDEEIEEDEYNSNNYIDKYPDDNIKIKKSKKQKNKFQLSDISYHCSLIKGNYYKYKKDKYMNNTQTKILFKCYNPKCKSCGIYDTTNKTFMLKKPHWVGNTYLCYKHLMTEQDKINHNYMKENNIEEIQMFLD